MLQPPANLEEFLKSQKLGDWPDNPIMEDSVSLLLELGSFYTSEALSKYFYKNAPLKQEVITDLEIKINENASLLEKYFSQTVKPVETKVAESDDVASQMKETKKEKSDIRQEKRKEHVEHCTFPGFKIKKLTELPGNLEGPQVLNYVTKAQNFKPNQEDQDHLFDRIADSFVALFWSVHPDVKDAFFKVYADCLSQAVCAVFFGAFPVSHMVFDDKFKEELINLIFQWVSGIKPVPSSWKKWNLDFNDMNEISHKNEILYTGLVTGQIGRNQLDFNLDKLIQDARESRLSDEEIKDIRSMMDTAAKSAAITESHNIGPGPRFCRVLFKLGGHSPLVSHYLKMHAVTNVLTCTLSHKLQRTEISKLPSVAPTYQDVIKDSERIRKNEQMDYNILRDKAKKEHLDMEQQRLRVNMQIERMMHPVSEISPRKKLQ